MGFRRRDDNPYYLDDSEPNVKPPFIAVALYYIIGIRFTALLLLSSTIFAGLVSEKKEVLTKVPAP